MKIIVAKTAGFCFGVRRAVQTVLDSIGRYDSLCTLGPIIHNPQVVKELEDKGVYVANSVDEVNTQAVVIRSHGCTPYETKALLAKGVTVLDATCPYVQKIHSIVTDAYARGEQIVVVGEREHPEVIGINGCCNNKATIINSLEEVETVQKTQKTVCLVAQTTTNIKLWKLVVEFFVKSGYNVQVHQTICAATGKRQAEAEELARKCDCMVVIGGNQSSNTQKLYRICKAVQNRTYVIEDKQQLNTVNYNIFDTIGISAGASTPDRVIKEVVEGMSEIEKLENNDSDFVTAMDKTLVRIKAGQQITGTVIYVDDNEVGVNIGYKSDGFISKDELTCEGNVNPREVVKPGDEIDVEVIKVNDGNGNVILSKKSIEERLKKDKVLSEIKDGASFNVTVKEAVKGGVLGNIDGITVFIPASQLKNRSFVKDLTKFVGQELTVRALEVDTKKRRVVASRAVIQAEERAAREAEFWGSISEGDVVEGEVRRITKFGAFIGLGMYDGLLHISDLAWGHVDNVTDIVNIGDRIQVKVLAIDTEKKQISLGYKQLQPKPWELAGEMFPDGTIVHGKVVRIQTFGAFVNIARGIDGMVHISEIVDRYIKNVEDVLKPGQEVDAVVLQCDPAAKRISLSIKALGEQALNPGQPLPVEDNAEDADEVVTDEVAEEVTEEKTED